MPNSAAQKAVAQQSGTNCWAPLEAKTKNLCNPSSFNLEPHTNLKRHMPGTKVQAWHLQARCDPSWAWLAQNAHSKPAKASRLRAYSQLSHLNPGITCIHPPGVPDNVDSSLIFLPARASAKALPQECGRMLGTVPNSEVQAWILVLAPGKRPMKHACSWHSRAGRHQCTRQS